MRYADLPVSLLGSPGAVRRFRRRSMIDGWPVFGFLAAAVGSLVAVGWLRASIERWMA